VRNTSLGNRQYYLDQVRVITILLVFLFHCNRFFDSDGWHAKNAISSPVSDFFSFFMVEWMMPMFFFISGASTWFALQSKTGGRFVMDRTKRILVPLIFGIFILSPHQVYFERLTYGQFSGSFLAFLPHYFSGWYAFGGNFAWMGLHLWYLLLLFVFSLVALPLFLLLKRKRARAASGLEGKELLSGSAGRVREEAGRVREEAGRVNQDNGQPQKRHGWVRWGYLVAFILLLAIPGWVLSPDGKLGGRLWGGWSLLEHLVLFVMGYYAFSRPAIVRSWQDKRYALLIATVALTALNSYLFLHHIRFPFGTGPYLLKILLRAIVCVSWILTILGWAERKLNYTDSRLKYNNEAVLPFYILHQPVILLIGYFVVQWQVPLALKYAMIALSSFIVIMLVYEYAVKRVAVLRFLFGIGKPVRK